MGMRGSLYHYLFLALAVLNMVAGFQALGTLMALGLILLPAVAASFWAREVWSMTLIAAPMAFASAAIGLLVSFHAGLPSGPVIVLFASLFFLGSLLLGSRASVRVRLVASGSLARLGRAARLAPSREEATMTASAGARRHAQDRQGQQHRHALRRDRQRSAGAVLPRLAGELVLVAASARRR